MIDGIEEAIARELSLVELPVVNRFTPKLYIREIFMPAGTVLTSRTHKFEHPFVISKGKVSVWTPKEGTVTYEAPHTGITLPGTRRVLFIHEDTVWTTFHVNEEEIQDPDDLVHQLTEPHDNPRMVAALKARKDLNHLTTTEEAFL